jgi:tripartite-type tricarboxylate transporter receptor subunit TctC
MRTSPATLLDAALAAGLLLLAAHGAAAADFPTRTVKIVVPNPAGGTANALPRILADALSKLRILAVCTPERLPLIPDVPTMSEAALPGFVSVAWFGLVAPPWTPDEIVEKLNKDVVAALGTEAVRARYRAQGAEPMATSVAETVAFIERERTLWNGVIAKANLKPKE